MNIAQQDRIDNTLIQLFYNAKDDKSKMMKRFIKSAFRPMQPSDFKDVYLSISQEQGEDLKELIQHKNLKNIVEFGTSFGISTLYLAQGVSETDGNIITTELIEEKANKAIENFKDAGVNHLIEVRVGNAMETLAHHKAPIDLLLLDGWKDLYLPLFRQLEPNFHEGTVVYVDNADMGEIHTFLRTVGQNAKYHLQSQHKGKVVLITLNEK